MIAPTVEEQLAALAVAAALARTTALEVSAEDRELLERRARVLDYIRNRLELFANRAAADRRAAGGGE